MLPSPVRDFQGIPETREDREEAAAVAMAGLVALHDLCNLRKHLPIDTGATNPRETDDPHTPKTAHKATVVHHHDRGTNQNNTMAGDRRNLAISHRRWAGTASLRCHHHPQSADHLQERETEITPRRKLVNVRKACGLRMKDTSSRLQSRRRRERQRMATLQPAPRPRATKTTPPVDPQNPWMS